MRWLGNVSIEKEYRWMVVYLDTKEEVDRLLAKMTVTMANGECAYTRPFVIGRQPARCYGANFTAICTTAAERRPQSVDSVHS